MLVKVTSMRRYVILAAAVLLILFMIMSGGQNKDNSIKKVFGSQLVREAESAVCDMFMPLAGFDSETDGFFAGLMEEQVENLMPIYEYGKLVTIENEDEIRKDEYIYEDSL